MSVAKGVGIGGGERSSRVFLDGVSGKSGYSHGKAVGGNSLA